MKLHSVWRFRGIFNVSPSIAHYDTLFTERDKMIEACDALVAWKPHFNVNYTAKMPFIVQLWIVQELHVFNSG